MGTNLKMGLWLLTGGTNKAKTPDLNLSALCVRSRTDRGEAPRGTQDPKNVDEKSVGVELSAATFCWLNRLQTQTT